METMELVKARNPNLSIREGIQLFQGSPERCRRCGPARKIGAPHHKAELSFLQVWLFILRIGQIQSKSSAFADRSDRIREQSLECSASHSVIFPVFCGALP
jgi:hypothetical protein